MIPFRFHPAAEGEVHAAAQYYDATMGGLGLEFLADLEQCIGAARTFPRSGTSYEASTRRILFRRFPFALIYLHEREEIIIVAVAHQRQEPGYWRARIG